MNRSDWEIFASVVNPAIRISDLTDEERAFLDMMRIAYKYLSREIGKGEKQLC